MAHFSHGVAVEYSLGRISPRNSASNTFKAPEGRPQSLPIHLQSPLRGLIVLDLRFLGLTPQALLVRPSGTAEMRNF